MCATAPPAFVFGDGSHYNICSKPVLVPTVTRFKWRPLSERNTLACALLRSRSPSPTDSPDNRKCPAKSFSRVCSYRGRCVLGVNSSIHAALKGAAYSITIETLAEMPATFYQSEIDQPHPGRARALLKAHPEIRQLMVRNRWTALLAFSIVVLQTGVAFAMGKLGFHYWWLSLLIAYFVGAFANHANYVIIHDATHNLIFRKQSWNIFVAVLADLPNIVPGAMGFRVYHLKHHSHQGDYEHDADLANHWEARLVGNVWYRKAVWLMLFPFFQVTRPPRLKAITMWDRWFAVNLLCAIIYDVAVVYFTGWPGFVYLALSSFFSIGL